MNVYLQYALYAYLGLSGVLLGKQVFFPASEIEFEQIISEQLEGKLGPSARALSELNLKVNAVESRMVTHSELQERSKEIIGDLGAKTQRDIEEYMKRTNSKVDAVSRSVRTLTATVRKGRKITPKPDKPVEPPPEEWEGITVDQIYWCQSAPSTCALYPFVWETDGQVKGKPMARFSTTNIWGSDFKVDLNLAFKVSSIMFREDPNSARSGAVRNQSIFISAGYFNERGEFVGVAESELLQDEDNYLIHAPTKTLGGRDGLSLLDLSVLGGPSFDGDFGVSVGGGVVNLLKGDLRFGGQAQISGNGLSAGPFVAYRLSLFKRRTNIAPFVGYTWNVSDLSPALNAGLYFIAW